MDYKMFKIDIEESLDITLMAKSRFSSMYLNLNVDNFMFYDDTCEISIECDLGKIDFDCKKLERRFCPEEMEVWYEYKDKNDELILVLTN